MPIVWGGNQISRVSSDLASAFADGDSLLVMQHSGELLHIPREAQDLAESAVTAAVAAFGRMGAVSDDQITRFYLDFAANLADDTRFAHIEEANRQDIASAHDRNRSTTRLVLDERMRTDMIEGLKGWAEAPSGRGRVQDTIEHEGWTLDHVVDGLGVIGFVFEGRPNVFADATGVLRGGNTVVFRIGSDALGTARAIVSHALTPALASSGLPAGAASLVASASRASAWAMMADPRLSLAVARGSGAATTQLGAVARQAGNAVSLHGTGGGWIVAAPDADPQALGAAVYHSLDRKVCNTVNTVCIPEGQAADLVPVVLHALDRAAERLNTNAKLHVLDTSASWVPEEWFDSTVPISRAGGMIDEPKAETLGEAALGEEWEWEQSPEVTLAVVGDVDHAMELFNKYSPRFVVSLVSEDRDLHQRFFAGVDSPFVGNGFTRWVDGQYALNRPELGLSNWQGGRLFGRSGILSGDSAYSIRLRVTQDDPDIGR
ncbi:MAG: aldehyde dehydrogenase family protein [Acidimicrobiia bacterium]